MSWVSVKIIAEGIFFGFRKYIARTKDPVGSYRCAWRGAGGRSEKKNLVGGGFKKRSNI
jgi:hypothetical protein